jgi:hypothetical protein
MQFEEFDNKIKEAANAHHPSYREDAWSKMEELLDEHLPVKEKKRRRFIIWWFVPVIIGAGLGIYKLTSSRNNSNPKSISPTTQVRQSDKLAAALQPNTLVTKEAAVELEKEKEAKPLTDENSRTYQEAQNKPQTKRVDNNLSSEYLKPSHKTKEATLPIITKVVKEKTNNSLTSIEKKSEVFIEKKRQPSATIAKLQEANLPAIKEEQDVKKEEKSIASSSSKVVSTITPTATANLPSAINIDSVMSAPSNNTSKKKSKNTLYITAAAGADVSFVSANENGKIKPMTGIGLAYLINNKIMIKAGFYGGEKVYAAKGSSYKGSSSFYQHYPYLDKVNANCKIYEIPIGVSYHFAQTNKQSFFAAAAVSSLIMKQETYDYYYRYTPTGRLYEKSWTYNNENKHLLSIVTISAGYQKNITPKIFITTEPYFKFATKGIGAGSIKLNSTGILFTTGFKL